MTLDLEQLELPSKETTLLSHFSSQFDTVFVALNPFAQGPAKEFAFWHRDTRPYQILLQDVTAVPWKTMARKFGFRDVWDFAQAVYFTEGSANKTAARRYIDLMQRKPSSLSSASNSSGLIERWKRMKRRARERRQEAHTLGLSAPSEDRLCVFILRDICDQLRRDGATQLGYSDLWRDDSIRDFPLAIEQMNEFKFRAIGSEALINQDARLCVFHNKGRFDTFVCTRGPEFKNFAANLGLEGFYADSNTSSLWHHAKVRPTNLNF